MLVKKSLDYQKQKLSLPDNVLFRTPSFFADGQVDSRKMRASLERFLYPYQTVVLPEAFYAPRSPGLDLSGTGGNGKVRDEVVRISPFRRA